MHLQNRSYLVSAVIAATLLSVVFIAGEVVGSHGKRSMPVTPRHEEWEPDSGSSPYRFLTVLVDRDSYFIGDERVPFDDLRDVLRDRAKELRANGVAIYGTATSHFGSAVAALDAVRALHFTRVSFESRLLIPEKTRLEAIEMRRDWYSETVQDSPNQVPLPTPASDTPAVGAPVAPPPGAASR
jgi:biopolymer transport protein ExbD